MRHRGRKRETGKDRAPVSSGLRSKRAGWHAPQGSVSGFSYGQNLMAT
jgi:hypothetical protein